MQVPCFKIQFSEPRLEYLFVIGIKNVISQYE